MMDWLPDPTPNYSGGWCWLVGAGGGAVHPFHTGAVRRFILNVLVPPLFLSDEG